MAIKVSPIYCNLKTEDTQTPETLTRYFMRGIIRTGYKEAQLHLRLGGFWFNILTPQISGLEGELMLFDTPGFSNDISLLLRLNQGLYLPPEAPFTLWKKIGSFSLSKQQERLLAGFKRMFDVANAFETGDYKMKLGSTDFSKPYESLHCYTIDSLTLRGKEILLHPNSLIQEQLEQRTQQPLHGLTPEQIERIHKDNRFEAEDARIDCS